MAGRPGGAPPRGRLLRTARNQRGRGRLTASRVAHRQEILGRLQLRIDAERTLLYSSDWPHWDFDPPARIMTIEGLSETARDNILGRTAQRLFGTDKLPEPARLAGPDA